MKKQQLDIFREHLQSHGLKNTHQREDILARVMELKQHLSPEDIYILLRKKIPRLGRATVFRTLNLLEECGLVSHITSANGTRKFEPKHGRPHHDHMICVDCGDVLEFSSPAIERIQEQVAKKLNFKISWHRHEIFGRCRPCQEKR